MSFPCFASAKGYINCGKVQYGLPVVSMQDSGTAKGETKFEIKESFDKLSHYIQLL